MKIGSTITAALLALVVFLGLPLQSGAQFTENESRPTSESDPAMGRLFFGKIKHLLRGYYFDDDFRGANIEKIFETTDTNLRSMASLQDMFAMSSGALMQLDDPNTYLLPPARVSVPAYGFATMMVGDQCLVTFVRPDSQADKANLRIGDQITAFGSVVPTHHNHWQINMMFYAVNPLAKIHLSVLGLDKIKREIDIDTEYVSGKDRADEMARERDRALKEPYVCKQLSPEVATCRIRTFAAKVSGLFCSIRQDKKLINDLRGTTRGDDDAVLDFVGHLLPRDTLVFRTREKKKIKDRIAPTSKEFFDGDIGILVDSRTTGAAEIVARVLQIQQRARIFGDVTAGVVTRGEVLVVQVPRNIGRTAVNDMLTLIGVSTAEPIMSDGSHLHGTGVIPDKPMGPSGFALRQKIDPILSQVAKAYGVDITPKQAADLSFFDPPRFEGLLVSDTPTKDWVEEIPTRIPN
jgi:C-terminal processing protease CtpA/Prc